jgi:16S rRNA (cytidine1402-2'-O)-methyltransferase
VSGRLTVVATPIGNLGDLSPRAADALRQADVVACEDTRRTATLLREAGSRAPMLPAHEHNEAARAADLARRIVAGEHVVLVSDAGMPGISDPGARIVAAVVAAGAPVTVVPGPGAVEAALVASGLAGEGYTFLGFPPRRGAERERALAAAAAMAVPVVLFESPKRLPALLADLARLAPGRPAAVCRELTKLHEEVVRDVVEALASRFAEPVRGEVTVVLGASPPQVDRGDGALEDALGRLLDAGLTPATAATAATALGLGKRNAAYEAALAAAARRATR